MKSVEVKFNEALEALDKAGKRTKFDEKAKGLTTIETKLNCADQVLKESRIIRKHNGPGDNHPELLTESFTEGYVQETTTDPWRKQSDAALLDFMESRGEITAEQKRIALGQSPAEYNNLTEAQRKDYDFGRAIGLSESDSLKVAKLTAGRNLMTVGR